MQRQRGFTLVEIAIAVFIMLLLMVIAVPSLRGVLANRRLQRSLNDFNKLVHEAQERSIDERRSYLIVWNEKSLALRPEEWERGEEKKPVDLYSLHAGDSFELQLPAALQKEPPAQWIFWPSGNCEPAVVKYRGTDGVWSAKFSGLTAQPQITLYAAK